MTHLGDVVDDPHNITQWQVASRAMGKLDGVVPYAIAPGNHDMDKNGVALYLNQYFPADKFERHSWWGDGFQTEKSGLSASKRKGIKNSYQLFTAGGKKYLFLHLEFCPPDEVLSWANSIIKNNDDRKVLISSHLFMSGNNMRRDPRYPKCYFPAEGTNDGEDIWQKLIIKNSQKVKLVMGGHFSNKNGAAKRTDQVGNHRIHQLFSNYQHRQNGGNGFLRILEFDNEQNIIKVKTYSPFLDTYLEDPWNSFTLQM